MLIIKRIIFNIIIVVVIVYIIDLGIGRMLSHFYFKEKAGQHYCTTYSMDSTTAEILIFGSSRANHHYVPEIFEKGLKMSYYNCGRDGNSILYNYAVFKVVLNRYTPKIIILDISPYEYYYSSVMSYDRLSSLLPYYANKPEIRSIVNLRSCYEKIKLLSAIYPFNSNIITIGIGNLDINKKRKPDNKGYLQLSGRMKKYEFVPMELSSLKIDTNKFQALCSIAKICNERNILLLVCYSPIYIKTYPTKIDTMIKKLEASYKYKYIDMSNDDIFIKKPDLFCDINHLNNQGAITYSSIILDSIASYLEIVPVK